MYKLHLILKYLRKRRIAWVSLIAVMLCTAMVIVVISVMGGWLRMFRETYHAITGDIVVSRRTLTGFPYYGEMMDRIEKLPEVQAAVPTIRTYGLINVMVGNEAQIRDMVSVVGIDLKRVGNVTGFRKSLYRQHEQAMELASDPKTLPGERKQWLALANGPASFDKPLSSEDYKRVLPKATVDVSNWPGMIVGAGVIGIRKGQNGETIGRAQDVEYSAWVRLTTVAVTNESTNIDLMGDKSEQPYWIVDDSRTKVWQVDSSTVYVPFDVLQGNLRMVEQKDPEAGKVDPARTNDIRIGLKDGADLNGARAKVQAIVDDVLSSHSLSLTAMDPVVVQTWEEFNAKFIAAVEHEIVLTVFLFAFISVVAVFLIFCIFYMIVVEKTKDIGIIKSVGGTNAGVLQIFLGYGLAIGIVGGGLGLLVSYLIVHNINQIHTWLSHALGVTVWSAETYAFETIPNALNPKHVAIIMLVAVIASVLGALLPAFRAARLHPIEALRWE